MNRLRPLALPALASVFALLLAVECLLPGSNAVPPRKTLEIPAASPDAAADAAAGQWGDTILARPLFNPDRRPVRTADADAGTGLPRLSAIIIVTGGTRAAVFAADGQKPQVVAAGGTIDGYQLTNIAPDSVELLGPAGSLTLRPRFISTPPANATAIPSTSSSINDENPN